MENKIRVKVEFEIELEKVYEYTEKEVEDYLRYIFKNNGYVPIENPFAKFYNDKYEPESIVGTFKIKIKKEK